MKRIVVKLSGMASDLPARPATTRWLSATSYEYPAAAQASSRTARPERSSPRTVRTRGPCKRITRAT